MVATGLACLVVAVRHRGLRIPVLAAWAVTATALGVFLGLNTLVDRTVHETVVVAGPAMEIPDAPREAAPPGTSSSRAAGCAPASTRPPASRPSSAFPRGTRYLTLTRFSTSPGPDLRVRLGGRDLGALKGNRGDQQYRVPAGVAVEGARVVIWCRAFSVEFGSALPAADAA